MNFSMIENLTYPIFMSLVLSAIPLMTVKILLTTMASEQFSSGPGPKLLTPGTIIIAPEPAVSTGIPSSTTIDQDAPSTSTSHIPPKTPSPVIPLVVEEADHDIEVAHMNNKPSVSTRQQLHDEALFCYFDAFLSSVEPKSYKDALTESWSGVSSILRIQSVGNTTMVTLKAYYEEVRISHQTSVARTPQQNGVVERRNHTLMEAARTMLIFSKAPLFISVEAVAAACYTQNRSLIQKRHNKTSYELLHDRKPDLSYLHVFGALCYPANYGKDLSKLKPKAYIGIFVCYAPAKKHFESTTKGPE
ncbi:retrovirus-related pol polyprotein from transposon TNT 1-94 [Tanacetum coccineum]